MAKVIYYPSAAAELWTPAKATLEIALWAGDPSTIIYSGSDLTQWQDTSGNARHANITTAIRRPTVTAGFNGFTGITFNGSQDLTHGLNGTGTVGPRTIMAFYKTSTTAQTGYRGVFNVGAGVNGTMLLARNGGGFIGSYGGPDIDSNVSYAADSYFFVTLEDNQLTTGTKSVRVNGQAAGTYTANPSGAYPSYIGGDISQGQGTSMVVRGCWSVAGIGDTALAQRMEGWAFHEADLAALLPAGHPFKSSPPTV